MTRYQDDDGVWHDKKELATKLYEAFERGAEEDMEKFFKEKVEAGGVIPKGENKIKYWPIRDADGKEHQLLVDDKKGYGNREVSHYKWRGGIEPIDFIMSNGFDFPEGCIIKYIYRYKKADGVKDLVEARDYLDMLIQREKERGEEQ